MQKREIFYSKIAEENFRIVEVTVDVFAVKLFPVVSENGENEANDTASYKTQLHEGIHGWWNVRGKVEPVDCESQEGGHQQGADRTAVL